MSKIIFYGALFSSLILAFSAYSFFTFVHRKELVSIHKTINEFQKNTLLNGVVLVAQNNMIIYRKAFGYANKQTNILNNQSTQFLLASLTKTYTATAILLLVQKGNINLHKPVSEYLKLDNPVWQGKMPESMNQITIHHLLTHSSGLPKHTQLPGFSEWYEKIHTPEQLIQFFAWQPLSFTPGSRFEYTGSNYLLLGLIIEAITGTTYQNFMTEHVFQPLHLLSTFVAEPSMLITIQKQCPQLSIGYNLDEKTKQVQPAGMVNMSTQFAESGIISTANDLFTFISALFSARILNEQTIKKMTTAYFTTADNEGIGYGITIDNLLYKIYQHTGRINGYESIFMYEPQKKITVIILSNVMGSNIYPLAYELMSIMQ